MLHNIFKCEDEINITWLLHIIEPNISTQYEGQQRTTDDKMNEMPIESQKRSRETIHKDLTLYLGRHENLAWFGKFVISIKIEITTSQNLSFYIQFFP